MGTIYRDAESGQFVTRAYAEANPATTVGEEVDDRTFGDHVTSASEALQLVSTLAKEVEYAEARVVDVNEDLMMACSVAEAFGVPSKEVRLQSGYRWDALS
jgi:hypothetical protein